MNTNQNNRSYDSAERNWKKRSSELSGYRATYYKTNLYNDYIRVDYNLKEKKIRLYVEASSEGGTPYASIIVNGKITSEKNVVSGRSHGFENIFSSRASEFSSVPDPDVVALMAGNYGIRVSASSVRQKKAERRERLEETRKKYFNQLPEDKKRVLGSGTPLFRKMNIPDAVEFILGIACVFLAFYLSGYSYRTAGAVSAVFAMAAGLFDMVIMGRDVNVLCTVFFALAGIAGYVYGTFLI